jgi:hypothetical protein
MGASNSYSKLHGSKIAVCGLLGNIIIHEALEKL